MIAPDIWQYHHADLNNGRLWVARQICCFVIRNPTARKNFIRLIRVKLSHLFSLPQHFGAWAALVLDKLHQTIDYNGGTITNQQQEAAVDMTGADTAWQCCCWCSWHYAVGSPTAAAAVTWARWSSSSSSSSSSSCCCCCFHCSRGLFPSTGTTAIACCLVACCVACTPGSHSPSKQLWIAGDYC